MEQFQGWKWGELPTNLSIDGVSGATLTSLALAEGIVRRMGRSRPSLIFPAELQLEDVRDWFPDASELRTKGASTAVHANTGQRLGTVVRSGPLCDDVVGYQGPTELLFQVGEPAFPLNRESMFASVRLRSSFDNEPYVGYIRDEPWFLRFFANRSLIDLASLSPDDEGIEGVSGATMTSLAVAQTVVESAQALVAATTRGSTTDKRASVPIRWDAASVATACLVLFSAIGIRVRSKSLTTKRLSRRVWLVLVFIIIGLWTGNLLSLALIAGWSAEGIAWRLAPGLATLVAAAFLLPPLTKSNLYCHHLCPHGAAQQLIRPVATTLLRRRNRAQQTLRRLNRLPGILLVVAYLSLLTLPSIDLSSWEPFHAYVLRIAGWTSIAFALGTLAISSVVPMGYCKLGCPTGRLLDYLRRSSTSHQIRLADGVAIVLMLLGWYVRLFLR